MSGLGTLTLVTTLLLIVVAILWILMPFAVFGTKPKLDEAIAELKKTNAKLDELNALINALLRRA